MQKNIFSQLNKDMQIRICTTPQFTPVTKNPDDETAQQAIQRQNKFIALSVDIKNKLCSVGISKEIQEIGKQFNLDLFQVASISRAIRGFYFKEIKIEEFPSYFFKEIGVDNVKAKQIADIVSNRIIKNSSIAKLSTVKISLPEALNAYPNLGEQNVTINQLKLRYFPTPVRPSIKNWITDYRDNFGAGKHSPIDRGNFLFHSENGKTLSTFDRQKLGTVLKSLDEQTLLTIDPEAQKIIFEKTVDSNPAQIATRENIIEKNISRTPEDSGKFQTLTPRPSTVDNQKIADRQNENINTRTNVINPANIDLKNCPVFENFSQKVASQKPIVNFAEPSQDGNVPGPNILDSNNNISWQSNNVNPRLESIEEYQNQDSLSDEALFAKLQQKNLHSVTEVSNNIAKQGEISFSSPQRFGAEQEKIISKESPYHITPRKSQPENQQANQIPKVNRNIVDLKN